jgi:hypothetical protein
MECWLEMWKGNREIVSKGKGEKVKCWFEVWKERKTKRGRERSYIET